MTDIVINRCPRASLLSDAGKAEYLARKSLVEFDWTTLNRSDATLVAMMLEDAGKRVWAGDCSQVRIVTVPDGMPWKVMSKNNWEWVAAPGGVSG